VQVARFERERPVDGLVQRGNVVQLLAREREQDTGLGIAQAGGKDRFQMTAGGERVAGLERSRSGAQRGVLVDGRLPAAGGGEAEKKDGGPKPAVSGRQCTAIRT